MIRDGKPANFSGEGNAAGNWLIFGVSLVLFLVSLYLLNFADFENVWWTFGGLLVLSTIVFFIGWQFTGQSNTVDEDFVTDPIHETKSPNL
ncbi:hypothetical protein GCM10023190_00110 [Enteractinococcus fodinae]|uniref:Uncharacterized protein n=1 Tax=Enteractinococcus fodinae TaxID=684663 RepID=A0ABU2B1N9_9MICC|nr:hypothetical protein [Enteractinococcus fodinae]MDR7347511.1 hypothetical protein [Enteractinococcus fodinae]